VSGAAATPLAPVPRGVSRGDRVLVLGLLGLLASASSLTPILNYDYWWHLATGRQILTTGGVPRQDPFSFTAEGRPWVDHEWLFQVLAYAGHTALGPAALVIMKTVAVLLVCLLLARHLGREGHGPAGMAVILAPALMGASFRLDVRPELATILLAPLVLHLVIRARDSGRPGPLLLVPPLVALWSNLHAGVIVAPAILAAGFTATLLAERFGTRSGAGTAPTGSAGGEAGSPPARPFARRLGMTAAAAALAVGANPYGFAVYSVPFEVARVLAALPSPNLEWARPGLAQFPLFWAALAVVVAVVLMKARRVDPIATPALLLAGVLAALHLRNIGLFFFLLAHGVARPGRALVEAVQRDRLYRIGTLGGRVRPGFIAAAVVLVAGIPALAWLPPGIVWGAGISSGNEPAAAGDFLEREGLGKRMFNDVRFGGYLIWRGHPERPVFIDGRNEIYSDLMPEIFAALKDPAAWTGLLERYRIGSAFLRYPPTLQKVIYPGGEGRQPVAAERAFSSAYFRRDAWALVYWDDDAMIYVRRGPEHDDLIARLEYRAVHPDDWRHLYAGVLTGRLPVAPILVEIRRKLQEDPSCRRARTLLATFSGLEEGMRAGRQEGEGGGG
jgi:hypothetical protein